MFHLLQQILLHDKAVILKTYPLFHWHSCSQKTLGAGKVHDKTVKFWTLLPFITNYYNLSPGVWSQILPFIWYNARHNSSHNFSYSPNCNGCHHLSLSREMAEEQLRTWSYQSDLSLFLICTVVVHYICLDCMAESSCYIKLWMILQRLCSLSSGSSSCAFLKGKLQPSGWSHNSPAWSLPSQLSWLPRASTFFAALFMLQKTSVRVYSQGERSWQTVIFHSSA